jgi:hypothetical protein
LRQIYIRKLAMGACNNCNCTATEGSTEYLIGNVSL